jgi:hypothetical protein
MIIVDIEASMRAIPLNLMTLYADLQQSVELGGGPPRSVAIKGKRYVYATTKDGSTRVEKYLGTVGDPEVQKEVDRAKHAAERAKALRNTVTLLKRGRFPAPSLALGRILEVVSNAGLFKRGMTLVGTGAYQTYAGVTGYYLPSATIATNDADLSVAEFVPGDDEEDIESILKRANPTFRPVWFAGDKLPRAFRSSDGFTVDMLTRKGRDDRPVLFEALDFAAVPLRFQEFPVEDSIEVVALYGAGVPVRVPTPARFAVHKLILAQHRKSTEVAKRQKDVRQAQELIDILLVSDEAALQDALDDGRARGRSWKTAINATLKEMGREARPGVPPLPVEKRRKKIKA